MGSLRPPGSTCTFSLFTDINDGTLCRQPSPVPGPASGFSLWPELYEPGYLAAAIGLDSAISESDKAEFAIVKKMPVYDHRRQAYRSVNSYVADRTRFFGSPFTYATFAAESDAELAGTKWVRKKKTRTLRSMLEFGHNTKQQQIFYRWVRKAYMDKYGNDINVPELIRKGMSQELADKLAEVKGSIRVKKIHAEQFQAGGFNPRPIKYDHHYLLGTLSEHGTGMAVDIEDGQNAQLTIEEWKFIETLAGKKDLTRKRWKTEAEAEALWKDIKEVNDLFVKKVASEVQRIVKERAEQEKKDKADKEKADKEKAGSGTPKPAAAAVPPRKQVPPLKEVLGKHYDSLAKWTASGFFNLPLELVLELQAHGFTWGATFSTNVDLHHFEIDQ